jgi:hypothetical protein
MKKHKRTNNNQQNITQKYKISFLLRIWTQICWSINMHVSHMSILRYKCRCFDKRGA